MDNFIAESLASADACHAKQLEAKRTLDGLTHQVTALSEQMSSQATLVESSTTNLEKAIGDKSVADAELETANQACSLRDTTVLTQYRSELDELEQMANPSVRSAIAAADESNAGLQKWLGDTRTTAQTVAEAEVSKLAPDQLVASAQALVNDASLVEESAATKILGGRPSQALVQWTPSTCQRFVSLLRTRRKRTQAAPVHGVTVADLKAQGVQYVELTCNETRVKLQDEYENAYSEISLLYQNAATEVATDLADCQAQAATEHESKMTVVNRRIREGTTSILAAKDLIGELQPLLEDVSLTASKVAEHIAWLESTCHVEAALTEHLRKVRDLIDTLEDCPGRNDFKLILPAVPGVPPASALP